MIGLPTATGVRLMAGNMVPRAMGRGAFFANMMLSSSTSRGIAGGALAGRMGMGALRGAAAMGTLNQAQYLAFGDRSGRGRSFGGFVGAGFRGSMAGAAMGGLAGAGSFFGRANDAMWRSMKHRVR